MLEKSTEFFKERAISRKEEGGRRKGKEEGGRRKEEGGRRKGE